MLAAVIAVLVSAAAVPATTPPDDPFPTDEETAGADAPTLGALPGEIGVGTTDFERQLAELGFVAFLARDLHVTPQALACTEPPTTTDAEVTCFALVDGEVVIATTGASAGTGDFSFEVLPLDLPADSMPPMSEPPVLDSGPEATEAITAAESADAAIVAYGSALEQSAAGSDGSGLSADPRLSEISFTFDPSTATARLEVTLSETEDFTLSEFAWVNTRGFARAYWSRTSPFRDPAAMLHPSLIIVVNDEEFVSNWELMSAVADERVSRASWTEQATAG